jgi:hypothetical protein
VGSELSQNGGKVTPGPTTQTVCGNDNDTRNEQSRQVHDQSTREAAFHALIPKLEVALDKPAFLVPRAPSQPYDAYRELPDWSHLRSLAGRLSVEAALEARRGHSDEAVRSAELAMKLARLPLEDETVRELGISLELESVAIRALEGVLTSPASPSAQSRVIKTIQQDRLPREALETTVQNQILTCRNTFSSSSSTVGSVVALLKLGTPGFSRRSPGSRTLGDLVLGASGLSQRELRMLDNDLFSELELARGAQPGETPTSGDAFWNDLSGRRGLIADTLDLPIESDRDTLRLERSKLGALQAGAAIRLFFKKNGVYPKTLDQLQTVGLSRWPDNEASPDPYQFENQNGKLHLVLPVDDEMVARKALDKVESGAAPDPTTWHFQDRALQILLPLR